MERNTMEQKLPGVYRAIKKDKTVYYRASITYNRKHISLGSFSAMEEAHAAYKAADNLLKDSSLSIEAYRMEQTPLSFDKWVCLVNLRDNKLYFHTPIYLRPNFFYYYLSEKTVLKFDIDDLFYYSSHKIMKRNGHLFVSDYGMQVNILNRYGIKNYGVCGKDYLFINGDSTDFRYENIEIINRFFGVSRQAENNRFVYRTKIHVNGDYLVGTYETETEAAIAYNKAIDCLKKAGVKKNFTPNYIDSVSASAYADIYSSLQISHKIEHFTDNAY